ncbi:type II toxin-antitoxin system HicB family antitoxin [Luteimonas sp. BDR2-5]|uniref:type II toxin-antitoxin system HicB family antitoxin n=1 Tax=Proluteimonas luteida TaxID=2878685 RepID=UPI001E3A491E|nr:type II toxin-antitoxin system HicB family antitoxin [Luteimonas sp. BDR2-5]MCD9029789.1 type II toxin-antitoxin system HicB family antitoxin [Luteimonas sp. BDR2-5]
MNKSNVLKIDGHPAVISYDPDIEMFRGEFVGLNGGADFYATNVRDLKAEGTRSLREFLAVCKERGIAPEKKFSGTFAVRVGKKKHEALAITAAARGVSMNALIDQAIEHELACA